MKGTKTACLEHIDKVRFSVIVDVPPSAWSQTRRSKTLSVSLGTLLGFCLILTLLSLRF